MISFTSLIDASVKIKHKRSDDDDDDEKVRGDECMVLRFVFILVS